MELIQPQRKPTSLHSAVVEDLLEMSERNQHRAVSAIVMMLHDLYELGVQSQYAKKLKGFPIWELKTNSRGGEVGGARVYFFVHEGCAVLTGAEVKEGDSPSEAKLLEAFRWFKIYRGDK